MSDALPTSALAVAEQHLRDPRHSITISASERADGWAMMVLVEYKTDTEGGRIWRKSVADFDKLKAALDLLGIQL